MLMMTALGFAVLVVLFGIAYAVNRHGEARLSRVH